MPATPTDDLLERLKDPAYAKLYGEENAKVDFAITLTRVRKSLDLSQRSLAEKLGISQPHVAKLEGGGANPTLGAIGRLLAAIDLRLVTGTAPLKPEPIPQSTVFLWVGAADGTGVEFGQETGLTTQAGWLSREPYPLAALSNAGIMADYTPLWSAKSGRREILVRGAAR